MFRGRGRSDLHGRRRISPRAVHIRHRSFHLILGRRYWNHRRIGRIQHPGKNGFIALLFKRCRTFSFYVQARDYKDAFAKSFVLS